MLLDYYWQRNKLYSVLITWLTIFAEPMADTMPSVTRMQKRQQALPGPMRLTIEGSPGVWPGDNPNQCAVIYSCFVSDESVGTINN